MKKILIITALLFVASVGYSFAASGVITGEINDKDSGDAIGKLSTNVTLAFQINKDSYAIAAKQTKGTKVYGSAAGDTKIYYDAIAPGTDVAAGDLTASDSAAFNSWTEM